MMKSQILVICTCFNRKAKTKKCIETISSGNSNLDFTFVVVDDGSTDGTVDMLKKMKGQHDIHLIQGMGNLFYSGGMHLGMEYALCKMPHTYDYLLMINDDVEFIAESIQQMVLQSLDQGGAVIVGAMRNEEGIQTYGAVKYVSGYKYKRLTIKDWLQPADTFNANCVLIPYHIFEKIGSIDSFYRHSLGDFDYGLSISRHHYKIFSSKVFVGICNNNDKGNTWMDTSLNRRERIVKKENVKGAPIKQWFYFLNKNFGLFVALRGTISPYIRILLQK